jgi:hypothetical protein
MEDVPLRKPERRTTYPCLVIRLRRLVTLLAAGPAVAASPAAEWEGVVLPWLENYCFDCHGDGIDKGELSFDDYPDIPSMTADRERWKRIRGHIEHHLMPPPDEFQPPGAERKKIVEWIDRAVFPVDPDHPDPGRVTLRRLNRVEHENTLRDLLGVPVEVRELLPPDDSGYGFDNIGDVLTLSPAHLDRFLQAAEVALDAAVHLGPMPFPSQEIDGRKIDGPGHRLDEGRLLTESGKVVVRPWLKHPGRYRIVVEAGASRAGDELAELALGLDGEPIHAWRIEAGLDQPVPHECEIRIDDRRQLLLEVAFTNDFYDPDAADPNLRDRNVLIRRLRLEGPLDGPRLPKPESHRRIFGERPEGASDEAWAADIFRRFARRAFRRPPREGEAGRYLHFIRLAKAGGRSFDEGVRHGLEAMLVSPAFLFREEPQPEPDNAQRIARIDEHALASRLSYFLWSTMPDERLLALADQGQLRARLDAEIDRMLDSDRAIALVENFVGQWLQLRDLRSIDLSRRSFPKFDDRLRSDMATETRLLVAHLIRENRPLTELLDADYSFLNEPLARHYGIDGVHGREFRKVSLQTTPRRGLLGHGSFLLVTSHPLRTSPVLRGKYVLENLLDTAPPPPPPNVPQLTPPGRDGKGLTLRQQMERHRDDPNCASCHALMDPIGFGLQNFDADGSHRTTEGGRPIDASGQLADGRKFDGVDGLRRILLTDHRRDFHRAVASKLLTYALGRGTDWYDRPAIDGIIRETEQAGDGTRAILKAVVHSVPFQFRRGDG